MAIGEAFKISDGKSITLTAPMDIPGNRLAVISTWVGVTGGSVASGNNVALQIAPFEYEFDLPAPSSGSWVVGGYVYVQHAVDGVPATYYNASAGDRIRVLRITALLGAPDADANRFTVRGILQSSHAVNSVN